MLGTLIIVFREVLEAGLIVGITMAATRGVARRGLWIAVGVLAGAFGAGLAALCMRALSSMFEGVGQELFNAAILLTAVVMLAWHNIWMASHGRELATEMRGVGHAVSAGTTTLAGLALVVGVAVLREGTEAALFLYGVVITAEENSGLALVAGGLAGLVLGGVVAAVTYFGLLTIPPRLFFSVTSALLALLAAGMAAQAIAFLEQANVVTALGQTLWDSSGVLSDTSLVGKALHTLVGYSDHPSAMQVVIYGATLIAIAALTRLFAGQPRVRNAERTA